MLEVQKSTNINYNVIETEYRNHCTEHLNGLEATKYSGVVIVSGDGLVHQFVNSNKKQVLPLAHIPAGSANAFSKTQTHMAGELCKEEEVVFLIVKGRIKKFNLIVIISI